MLALLPTSSALAQTGETGGITMALRGVPLEEALERLVAAAGINLVYEERLVREQRVFCMAKDASPEVLLHCILRESGLDFYRTSSGTYVLTEATRQAPCYGRLAGIVVDGTTGEPLPYANVLLADAGVGTAANAAGLFSFSSLASGPHRVVATYVGYEPAVDSIWVPPDGRVRRRITLHPRPVTARPIIVNGLQQRLPSQGLGRGRLTAERLARPAGTGTADVMRSASSMLGVSLQRPLADLHIQGGAAGAHQILLDGIPIRNPVTLGRLLGAFSPLAIERLTVHKAGFGAAHGSFLSGSIALRHALGSDAHRNVTVRVDPVSLSGRVQGQMALGGLKGAAMVALRTDVWDLYRDPALSRLLRTWRAADPLLLARQLDAPPSDVSLVPDPNGTQVDFSDLHAALRLYFDPFHTLYASFYRGGNVVEARSVTVEGGPPADSNAVAGARDRYHWTNWAGQVRYEWMQSARMLGTLRLYGSRQSLGHGYGMTTRAPGDSSSYQHAYDGDKISEVGMEAGLDYSLTAHHHLSGALTLRRVMARAFIDAGVFPSLTYAHTSWQFAAYGADEWSLGLGTTVEAGARLTYLPERRTLYAEPRLAVRHDGSHALLGTYAVRLAGGLYRQFVNHFALSSAGPTALAPSVRVWLPVDGSVAPPRAYHLAAEALWKPKETWQLNLESYYKWLPRLLTLDYAALLTAEDAATPPTTQAAFLAAGRGRAFGAGLRLQRTGAHFTSSLRYHFSRSQRTFPGRFEGRMMPAPWNQPHRLSVEGAFSFTPAFTAHLAWRGIWGRSWGFRKGYYDYFAPPAAPAGTHGAFDLADPAAHTLSPFYRLDAGLSYTHAWGGFDVQLHARLINVLGRRNVFDWSLHPAPGGYEKVARTLPGRHFALSVCVSY